MREWLWYPTRMPAFAANGCRRGARLTRVEEVMTSTPSALPISNTRVISSSVKSAAKGTSYDVSVTPASSKRFLRSFASVTARSSRHCRVASRRLPPSGTGMRSARST